MPIYRYECPFCKHEQDEYRKISERHYAPRCHGNMELKILPAMVSVFNTYQTVAHDKETGKPMKICSRAEHAAFLRRNGYEEVGNDRSMAPKSDEELTEARQKWNDAPDAPMVNVEKLKQEGWITEDLTV